MQSLEILATRNGNLLDAAADQLEGIHLARSEAQFSGIREPLTQAIRDFPQNLILTRLRHQAPERLGVLDRHRRQ